MGPPADKEYPVDPSGVETIKSSHENSFIKTFLLKAKRLINLEILL